MSTSHLHQTLMKAAPRRPTSKYVRGVSLAAMSTTESKQRAERLLARRRLRCHSVAYGEMPQLEFGDKIVLPAKMLLELQCLKIPTPYLFKIQAYRPTVCDPPGMTVQYCSVQEFSSPEGTSFLPYWMMQQLLIEEGAQIDISSIVDVPRGVYCRLQPESIDFLTLAAEIGPKILMESALRRYSVLAVDSQIVVIYGDEKFHLRVVDLKPEPVVSLCGDVDLETDFMIPENADPRRPRSQEDRHHSNQQQDHTLQEAFKDPASTITPDKNASEQSRLQTVTESKSHASYVANPNVISNRSLQAAQLLVRQKVASKAISVNVVSARAPENSTSIHLRCAQPAFSSIGHRLSVVPNKATDMGEMVSQSGLRSEDQEKTLTNLVHSVPIQDPSSRCPLCLSDIPDVSMEMHAIRCARNPAYHKFECVTCHERIITSAREQHIHCSQCSYVTSSTNKLVDHESDVHTLSSKCRDCGTMFTRIGLEEHKQQNDCTHALELCTHCGFAFKRKEMPTHMRSCSNRTDKCELCQRFFKLADMDLHSCAGPTTSDGTNPKSKSERTRGVASNNLTSAVESTHTSKLTTKNSVLECVYCSTTGFRDAESLERHTAIECHIARSFSPATHDNQQEERPTQTPTTKRTSSIENRLSPVPVKELLQGRLRRKGDAARVVRTRFPPINSSKSYSRSIFRGDETTNHTNPTPPDKMSRTQTKVRGGTQSLPAMANQKKQHQSAVPTSRDLGNDLLSVRSAACTLPTPSTNAKHRARQ